MTSRHKILEFSLEEGLSYVTHAAYQDALTLIARNDGSATPSLLIQFQLFKSYFLSTKKPTLFDCCIPVLLG